MIKFESTSAFDFRDKFKADNDCKAYLYHFKWKNGFTCEKCGHTHSWDNTVEYGKVCKKRKMMMVVEATKKNGIKRVYGMKINAYSGKDLQQLFDRHITKGSTVITDGWRGYNTVSGYNIVEDIKGMKKAINPMNRMIQQYKSWIRGVYHKSTHQHIEAYLNEFCFRINRSLWKKNMFHAAILKGLSYSPLTKPMIPEAYCFV